MVLAAALSSFDLMALVGARSGDEQQDMWSDPAETMKRLRTQARQAGEGPLGFVAVLRTRAADARRRCNYATSSK